MILIHLFKINSHLTPYCYFYSNVAQNMPYYISPQSHRGKYGVKNAISMRTVDVHRATREYEEEF